MTNETNTAASAASTEPTDAAGALATDTPAAASKPTVDPSSSAASEFTKDTPVAAVHSIEKPIGTEFPITAHESIAAKFEAKIEDIAFAIETDVENGVHRLKGWLKI
jgi:hypothetical protein